MQKKIKQFKTTLCSALQRLWLWRFYCYCSVEPLSLCRGQRKTHCALLQICHRRRILPLCSFMTKAFSTRPVNENVSRLVNVVFRQEKKSIVKAQWKLHWCIQGQGGKSSPIISDIGSSWKMEDTTVSRRCLPLADWKEKTVELVFRRDEEKSRTRINAPQGGVGSKTAYGLKTRSALSSSPSTLQADLKKKKRIFIKVSTRSVCFIFFILKYQVTGKVPRV